MTGFKIRRIYEEPAAEDGYRILVDRLWPRGVKKEAARLDEWNREIAPSGELRKWFGHKPERFDEFARLYNEELGTKKDELDRLRNLAKTTMVSLLYAAKDPRVNHANVLRERLSGK